jgi:hypothetical protein
VEDDKGYLLTDFHNILNTWKNYFTQLLNVHNVSDFRQREIHKAEPLVPDSSPYKVEKIYKLPGGDEILAEIIQPGGEIFCLQSTN